MSKEIITDSEKLSARAEEVDTVKDNASVRQTVIDLKNTIREKNIVALSAPQIGENKRIFVINFNGDLRAFVNPIITEYKGFGFVKETCESLPGKTYIHPRNNDITIMYQTPLGKIESRRMVGVAATVCQHMIDHLDGLDICDIGLEIDEDFEKASDDEKAEIIKMYRESLDIREKDIKEEIESDDELKKTYDAIQFMEKVQKGDVKLSEKKETVSHLLKEENKEENCEDKNDNS